VIGGLLIVFNKKERKVFDALFLEGIKVIGDMPC